MIYNIIVKKDGDGYLAKVEGHDNLFARGLTKQEANQELLNVIDMTMDYYLEQVETQRHIKNYLFKTSHLQHAL